MISGKKIAYLYDSASQFTHDEPEKNIYVVPNFIVYNKPNGEVQMLAEDVDINHEDFVRLLDSGASLSTSSVNPEQVRDKVEKLLQTYDYVYYVPMNCNMSSGYNEVLPIQKEINEKLEREALVVVKSNAASFISEVVMRRLNQLYDGTNSEEVQKIIWNEVEQRYYCAILLCNDISYLIKGGRVKRAKGFIAKLLNYKLLVLMDKKLDFLDKAISYSNQIQKMINFFNDLTVKTGRPIEELFIAYDGLESSRQKYEEEFHLRETLEKSLNWTENHKIYEGLLPECELVHTGLHNVSILIKLKLD